MRGEPLGDLVVIWSESRDTSEVWLVDAARPDVGTTVGRRPTDGRRVPRRAPRVRRRRATLLIVTDDGAVEFRLMPLPGAGAPDQDHTAWREARPEHPDERLGGPMRSRAQSSSRCVPVAGTGCACSARRPRRRRSRPHRRPPRGALRLARNTDYDAAAMTVEDES